MLALDRPETCASRFLLSSFQTACSENRSRGTARMLSRCLRREWESLLWKPFRKTPACGSVHQKFRPDQSPCTARELLPSLLPWLESLPVPSQKSHRQNVPSSPRDFLRSV